MIFYPYFELAASLFVLLLGFHIYTRHYANRAARFYGYFALLTFLAVIFEYSTRIAFTLDIARGIDRVGATLWAFLFSMFAHFTFIFTKQEKFLKRRLTYFLLYLPPAILGFLFIFTNFMFLRYEIRPFGIISQPAPPFLALGAQVAFFTTLGILTLWRYSQKTHQAIEKKQCQLISIGAGIPTLVGLFTDILLPTLWKITLIPTIVFGAAILNLFIYLAMRRYSLFAISPALAANTIIETMPDSMLVTDLEGRVILLNEEAHKFFHVPKEEIIGHKISGLFEHKDHYKKLYEEVIDKNLEVERFETALLDPLGERIPSLINANALRDEIGALLGIVLIVRDIRG